MLYYAQLALSPEPQAWDLDSDRNAFGEEFLMDAKTRQRKPGSHQAHHSPPDLNSMQTEWERVVNVTNQNELLRAQIKLEKQSQRRNMAKMKRQLEILHGRINMMRKSDWFQYIR